MPRDPLPALARIGKNVKMRRVELGLRQEDVVLDTGISRSHYSRIESGDVNMSITTLLRIAERLNCGITDLVAKVDELPH